MARELAVAIAGAGAWQQTEAKRVSGGGRDGRRKGGPFKPARVVLYVFDFFCLVGMIH